jgi:hypothetical protein
MHLLLNNIPSLVRALPRELMRRLNMFGYGLCVAAEASVDSF